MTDVLERVKTYQQFIGGEWVDSASGETLDVENPADGKVIAKVQASGAEDVDRAANAAATAFETWQHTTPAERSLMLLKLADAIEARADELGRLESKNAGKPVGAAIDEIPVVVDNLRFFAGAARVMEGKAANEYMAGHTSMIRREPVGVVASIAPWNYPIMMAGWKIGPALAAGNTVILKPSARTPLTALVLGRDRGRHPAAGVLNVITGTGAAIGDPLVGHPEGRDGLGHRRHRHRQAHRQDRGRPGQAAPPRARWQGAGHRLRRRRPRCGRREPSSCAATGTPARTAPRPRGSSPGRRSTTSSWPSSPTQVKIDQVGRPGRGRRHRDGLAHRRGAGRQGRGHGRSRAGRRRDRRRRRSPGPTGRVLRADRHRRPRPAQRDRPGRGLRAGRHGPALQRRGAGDRLGQRRPVRAGGVGLDGRRRAGMRVAKAIQFGTVWINDHFTLVSEMPHGGFKESGYGKDQSMYAIEDYTVVKHVMLKI